jgi:hypothetical protein
VIHPLQYELESARHAHRRSHAAQQRLVAEALHVGTDPKRSAPIMRTIAARLHGYVSTARRLTALGHAES